MGSDEHVVESHLRDDPEEALREFLTFIRAKLKGVERYVGDREVS